MLLRILKDITNEEIYSNHQIHMKKLMNSGFDFVLNETFQKNNIPQVIL